MDKKANYLALILLEALEDENMKACKQLLITYETDPNTIVLERGIAPIHYACGMENINFAEEIVKLMLNLGGDPNIRSDENLTPLHVAAIWGRKNIVKMLLEKGGDVNAIDDENKTPILYAIYECHFDVIKIIQNYVFEKKFEKKKNSLKKKCINNLNNSKNIINNNNLLTIKLIEDKKFTPNRINYNFDVTSPYYINITHRRKQDKRKHQQQEIESQNITNSNPIEVLETESNCNNIDVDDDDDEKLKSFNEHVPKNLFELTEDNLYEYARKMSTTEKLKISFINAWRDKVQKARTRKSIINQFNDIDSLLNGVLNDNNDINFTNTTYFIDGQDLNDLNDDKNSKSFNLTQFSKLLEQLNEQKYNEIKEQKQNDESFVTAPDKLSSSSTSNNKKDDNVNDTNFIRSPNLNDFVMQTAEEYLHTDKENGLIFYEKRLITNLNPKIGRPGNTKNGVAVLDKSHTSQSTDFTIPLDYDSEDLRKELTEFGHPPGPITKNTKKLYMKRLIKYKRNPEKFLQQNNNEKLNNNRPNFSVELEKTVRNIDWFKRIHDYMGLELEISNEFKTINKNGKCEWREGHLKTSFVYLLIDPRISDNLCGQSVYVDKHDIWKKFLKSIFYVGKGKSTRPYQHLYDAMKIFSKYYEKETKQIIEKVTIHGGQKIPKTVPLNILNDGKSLKNVTDSKKIERILDIWKSENGVICLNIFHNIIPAEAYTREAAIIDAIGLEHLTNMKRGDYYGITSSWSMRQRKHLGIALLYKALQIHLIEGESQLLPSDLI